MGWGAVGHWRKLETTFKPGTSSMTDPPSSTTKFDMKRLC